MGKRLLVGLFVVFSASIPGTRSVEAQAVNTNFVSLSPYSAVLMVASEALGQTLYRQEFRFFGTALFFRPVADGGGDGGSDGGSGTGTGGDGGDGGSDSGAPAPTRAIVADRPRTAPVRVTTAIRIAIPPLRPIQPIRPR